MSYTPDAATSTVFATLTVNGITFIVLYLIFEYVRSRNDDVFLPRLRVKDASPKAPDAGLFGWIRRLNEVSDEETLRMVGMDGFVFLRYLRMCAKMCIVCGTLGLCVLWPVYSTAPGNDGVAGINLYTMGNLEQGGSRLWASLVFCWLFNLIFLYLLYKEYEQFVVLRVEYMKHGSPLQSKQVTYSVMVENIPKPFRSAGALTEVFEELFPSDVFCASIVTGGCKELDVAVEDRKAALVNYENAYAYNQVASTEEDTPRKTVGLKDGKSVMCFAEEEVDAQNFFADEVERLDKVIAKLNYSARESRASQSSKSPGDKNIKQLVLAAQEEQQENNDEQEVEVEEPEMEVPTPSSNGFVTFTSRCSQVAAYQLKVLTQDRVPMFIRPAPDVSDLIWSNAHVAKPYTESAEKSTKIVFAMGVLFWAVVLAFIQAISNLDTLASFLPFVKSLDPVSYSLIGGLLPVIIMAVFLALLPLIFASAAMYVDRLKTFSGVQMYVFQWFFAYQLANVYLTLLSGSVFNSLANAIDNPASIITLLGSALPSVSVFFLNYSITMTLGSFVMTLLNIGPLVIINLFRILLKEGSLTRRKVVEGPLANVPINYGTILPSAMFILCIVLTYWVIAPLLLVVGAFFFVFFFFTMKFQLLYMITPQFETGGLFWFGMFKYTMLGLMVSSITMIGFFAIKEGAAQAPLLLPLPFVISYVWNLIDKSFELRASDLAYSVARKEDVAKGKASDFDNEMFIQPNFMAPNELKPEVYRVDNVPLWDESGNLSEMYHSAHYGEFVRENAEKVFNRAKSDEKV